MQAWPFCASAAHVDWHSRSLTETLLEIASVMPLKWTRPETCICSPSLARHEQSTGEHRASTEQAERPLACHALASSCAVLTSVHRAWGLGYHRLTEQLQCCRVEGQC